MPIRSHDAIPDAADAEAIVAIVERFGLLGSVRATGLPVETIYRIRAQRPVRHGTLLAVRLVVRALAIPPQESQP